MVCVWPGCEAPLPLLSSAPTCLEGRQSSEGSTGPDWVGQLPQHAESSNESSTSCGPEEIPAKLGSVALDCSQPTGVTVDGARK